MNENREKTVDEVAFARDDLFNEKSLFLLDVLKKRKRISNRELEELYFERFGKLPGSFLAPQKALVFRGLVRVEFSERVSFKNFVSEGEIDELHVLVFGFLERLSELLEKARNGKNG